jgi:hypothetical protein
MTLAEYADLLPDVGQFIVYKDKVYEIVRLSIESEMTDGSPYRFAKASVLEVDDNGDDVGNDIFYLMLDEIDYKVM